MVTHWNDIALAAAGLIGGAVALVHGTLTQRLLVRPVLARIPADSPGADTVRKLVVLLMHFSTFYWFVGGLALVAAAFVLPPPARLATAVLVGIAYLFAVAGNAWATRGRHPGWMLYAAAVVLILVGAA